MPAYAQLYYVTYMVKVETTFTDTLHSRIKKIEGLDHMKKIEVLDLHGNQISQVGGLSALMELKVLNLAGNQIRIISSRDLHGLHSLLELNLRRNRLRKLLGFDQVPNLSKLFLSNNDLQSLEDISSLARSPNIREISIDNNPVALGGDCVSFLVSYLSHLVKLNSMQITEQVRKAAMAWRRNKEATNAAFMDLTTDVSSTFRREEVISNARTNWELLRSQTKCLTSNPVEKSKNLKPDTDIVLTSLAKPAVKHSVKMTKSKSYINMKTKVPMLPDKKLHLVRTTSQETENSQNTSSSGSDLFKLPPILVPILNKMEQKIEDQSSVRMSGSLSSIGPNADSSVSSLASASGSGGEESDNSSSKESDNELEEEVDKEPSVVESNLQQETLTSLLSSEHSVKNKTDSSSVLSVATTTSSNLSGPSHSSNNSSISNRSLTRTVKSAVYGKSLSQKCHARAATAKVKKQTPLVAKDREQGGDYLIEICGRHLNIYGQGAVRFIDKPWDASRANDVIIAKFNYVNFNSITSTFCKLRHRFPNIDTLVFKETNIHCLGQFNALAEVQGFSSLSIEAEGNPICQKEWRMYAIYRLAHWGLKVINDKEITEEEIKTANEDYQSLSDLVLWSLPDVLLQPLLVRLRLDVNNGITEQNAKKWLLSADPELRSVVSKEALQWKKCSSVQEESLMKQKAKQHISTLLEEMVNAVNKLRLFEEEWPTILHNFVQNALLDYSQLDLYLKQKMQELNK
ncbi:unnamed protein product [Acanthoscelides obtectus]|uniref:Dynein axonemal assembly factor 1 homolog n=1 Tax=Acanthoscelides obtectus TaxID=200917 RepID=A0A9P0PFI7_ACAOB|nr:unnamed protein product [Acanthoscelides obtectus]CAK1657310.1 Leucine-rich repeat-containing protein 49 [Acanthoscelides obtectus]